MGKSIMKRVDSSQFTVKKRVDSSQFTVNRGSGRVLVDAI
jgi:hypothetical protein